MAARLSSSYLAIVILLYPALVLGEGLPAIPLSPRSVQNGTVDPAPPGYEEWVSPIVVPSPPQDGSGGWNLYVTRAKHFISQLTLEEKINLTTGVGTSGRCVGNTGALPRFNFTGICLQDSPLGVRFTDNNTAFPAAINVASTWDKDLMYRRGVAIGEEFVGKGVNVALGPMANLGRVPAGGRNWEGFGADPYLAGEGTAQTIKGMQSTGVSSCVKHYVGNEQEHFRGGSGGRSYSSNIDDRTMHELYDWPFGEAVKVGVEYVMFSYNRVNQTQATGNSKIINGILKTEHDFQGVALSDWAAVTSGVSTALAGIDMNMPGFTAYGVPDNQHNPAIANNSYWGANLVDAVRNGSVPEARLDDMVTRIMSAYYKAGQDSPSYPPVNFQSQTYGTTEDQILLNKHVNVQRNHYKIVREIGSASTVLLKNLRNTLPLPHPSTIRTIAVVGSDAGDNPEGPNGCKDGDGDKGCSQGTLAMGWGSGTANFPYLISPAKAIVNYVHQHSPSTDIKVITSDFDTGLVQKAAAAADVTLVHVNSDSGEGYITVDGNAGDRNNLTLWHGGEALIEGATDVSSNVVVIVHAVGPVLVESWIENPNVTAVLWASLPGQESGNAEVDVLWGAVNPSGRLTYTIAKNRSDYPADVLYKSDMVVPQITYEERLNIDYRHFDSAGIEPRFEFGYGLSYTNFNYSDISTRTTRNKLAARSSAIGLNLTKGTYIPAKGSSQAPELYEEVAEVTFKIQNIGKYDGHEVPQLYVSFPSGSGEPPRVLRGFNRVYLEKGASKTMSMSLRRKDVSIWDVVKQQWVTPTGDFNAHIGPSSRNLPLSQSFSVYNTC